MLEALMWGAVASSSVVLGGLIGSWFTVGKRTLGVIMAFGAGVLISAVAYELVFEAISEAKGTGAIGLGLFAGAFTFFFADRAIGKIGAGGRKAIKPAKQSAMIVPLVLGIVLDGIPESAVIGLGILETGAVSVAMLVAVFISNLPEAIAGTTGMKAAGWSRTKTMSLWLLIAVVCSLSTVAGYSLFAGASNFWLAFTGAFAAGAILMMLANTMIPEAYEHGGKLAGLFTVLGFSVSVLIILLERS
jgi:ZIP family zinc transporter